MRSYTTDDGFTITIFSAMYLDWGLQIYDDSRDETVFYNPHCICSESVGFYWEDEEGEPLDEGIDWSDEDWREYLECEADSLIEAFVPEQYWMDVKK